MRSSSEMKLQELRDYLVAVPAGEVDQAYRPAIINLLIEYWDGFQGSESGNTFAYKRMDTNGVAQRIAEAIVNGTICQELEWRTPDRYVLLNISAIVFGSNQQTISARRKRFREALNNLMIDRGWSPDNKGTRMGFRRMPQLVSAA